MTFKKEMESFERDLKDVEESLEQKGVKSVREEVLIVPESGYQGVVIYYAGYNSEKDTPFLPMISIDLYHSQKADERHLLKKVEAVGEVISVIEDSDGFEVRNVSAPKDEFQFGSMFLITTIEAGHVGSRSW